MEEGSSYGTQEEPKEKLACPVCSRTYSCKSTLDRHMKQVHIDVDLEEARETLSSGACPLCDAHVRNGDNIVVHLQEAHHVNIETEELHFDSIESRLFFANLCLPSPQFLVVLFDIVSY